MTATTRPAIDIRAVILTALTASIVVFFLWLIRPYIAAIALAAIVAALVRPAYQWLRKKTGRDSFAAFISIVLIFALIITPTLIMLYLFVEQTQQLLGGGIPWLQSQIEAFENNEGWSTTPIIMQLREAIGDVAPSIGEIARSASEVALEWAGGLTSGVAMLILKITVFIFAVLYFLRHGEWLLEEIRSYLKSFTGVRGSLLDRAFIVARATIKGTIVIAIIQGLLGALGFMATGLPAPVFWGAMMMILSVVPVIGTVFVWGPAAIYLVFNGEILSGVLLAAWGLVVISSVDNVLRPILVGADAKLPDFLVLVSTVGGIAAFGMAGIIFGPVLAALSISALTVAKCRYDEIAAGRPQPVSC